MYMHIYIQIYIYIYIYIYTSILCALQHVECQPPQKWGAIQKLPREAAAPRGLEDHDSDDFSTGKRNRSNGATSPCPSKLSDLSTPRYADTRVPSDSRASLGEGESGAGVDLAGG